MVMTSGNEIVSSRIRFREAACHAYRVLLVKYVGARDFLSLLGRLVSRSKIVPLDRLQNRPLQLYLLAHPKLYSAYQRVRVAGHSEGNTPLLPSDQRQGSDVSLRQQLSGCLPAELGRHSLMAHVRHSLMDHVPLTCAILLFCQQHWFALLV